MAISRHWVVDTLRRVAKYNRLLEIAAAHPSLHYGVPGPLAA